MHIHPPITETQRRMAAERQQRLMRLGRLKPLSKKQPPKPPQINPTTKYRLVCTKWPKGTVAAKGCGAQISMKEIVAQVAMKHGVTRRDIHSHRRSVPLIKARHEAMWRARQETKFSLPAIGRFFDRDHTTVFHAVRKHEERMASQTTAHDPNANVSRYIAKAAPLTPISVQNVSINNQNL